MMKYVELRLIPDAEYRTFNTSLNFKRIFTQKWISTAEFRQYIKFLMKNTIFP